MVAGLSAASRGYDLATTVRLAALGHLHPIIRGTYGSWQHMKQRCHNPQNRKFNYYGGRGIAVCAKWRNSFLSFLADMGVRPVGLTLERVDNNKGYGPENCRWATRLEQVSNRRNNIILDTNLGVMTLKAAAIAYGIHHGTLRDRIIKGWSTMSALTVKPKYRQRTRPPGKALGPGAA